MLKKITPNITQFYTRDARALTSLYRTGHVTHDQLKESCGVVDGRIRNYCRDNLVEKICFRNGSEIETSYKLTYAGKRVIESNWGLSNPYHAQNPVHDTAIANKYFTLNDDQRNSWITETEARNLIKEYCNELRDHGDYATADLYLGMLEKGFISPPDGIYIEDGVAVAFEVVTSSYGEIELEAKEAYAQVMGYHYEAVRA